MTILISAITGLYFGYRKYQIGEVGWTRQKLAKAKSNFCFL